MPEVRWELIDNGASFEHLVQTLVLRLDAKAIAFGRPGKDGGQDIRSGDGSLVYQCKFHKNRSASVVTSDAKKEAEKIKRYRDPGDQRFGQWARATRWCMVTNAEFNDTDQTKWDETVVPLFRELGLEPERWGCDKLNDLLAKNRDIAEYFFEGENRVLLSIGEAARQLENGDPFRPGAPLVPFQGRTPEMEEIEGFLESDKLFFLVHGQGAVGKTRLLIEAGLDCASGGDWQVLWGLTTEMSRSSRWFPAITRERETLLIIDDPESEDILRRLAEQISGSLPWKVLVAARSPHDPVVKYLQTFGIREKTQILQVDNLQLAEATAVAKSMIETGRLGSLPPAEINRAAGELATRLDGYPGWIAIAARVLENQGSLANLPVNIEDLAEKYLEEILSKQKVMPGDQLLHLLRWLALLGGVNGEDEAALERIRARLGFESRESLAQSLGDLVRRRVLIRRGARGRILEIKPDVMRDFILARWLAFDQRFGIARLQPSAAARDLAVEATNQLTSQGIQRETASILRSLARTETMLELSGRAVPILEDFFDRLRDSAPVMPASLLRSMIDLLSEIAAYYPNRIAELSRTLRTTTIADEPVHGILGVRTVGRRDVGLDLAWMVFHAAIGAREPADRLTVLRELFELAVLEQELAGDGLPNDGKRAGKLLQRVIEGGPSFWSEFDDAAATLAGNVLHQLAGKTTPAWTEAATAFLAAVTALERTRTWATNNRSISIQRVAVGSASPAGRLRTEVLAQIKARLAMPILPTEKRLVYWRVLADAHGNANSSRIQHAHDGVAVREEIVQDLKFALQTLPGRGFEELAIARPLWSWHAEFDKDQELSALGKRLEELYAGNTLAGEFEPLVGWEHGESHAVNAANKAQELAAQVAKAPGAITEFLTRADEYFAAHQHSERPGMLAWHLGNLAPQQPAVAGFIMAQLGGDEKLWRGEFIRLCAAGWMDALRQGAGERPDQRLDLLLAACGDDLHRAALVTRVYNRHSIGSVEPSAEEIRRVRSMAGLFLTLGRAERFAEILGKTFDCDAPGFRTAAESILGQLEGDALRDAVAALATAMASRVLATNVAPLLGTGEWLLNQLARVPKLYEFRELPRTYIHHFLRRTGKPSLDWLANALDGRALAEKQSGEPYSYLGNEVLAKFVEAVSEENQGDSSPAVAKLVELARDRSSVGHDIPDVLRYADPKGILAPRAVANLLGSIEDEDDFIWAGRCVRAFSFDSENWRIAARPLVERALPLSDKQRSNYYPLLLWQRSGAFQMNPGQVPQHALDDASAARVARDGETEEAFKPFREWWLKAAEAELQRWRDRAEEASEE